MNGPVLPADRTNPPRSARRFGLWAIGLTACAVLLALGVFLFLDSWLKDEPVPPKAVAFPPPVQPLPADDDPFADLPGTIPSPGNLAPLPFASADPVSLSQKYMFLSNEPEDQLKSVDLDKVAPAEVVAARRKHVAESAAELEKLAVAHRDALAALAAALDAQPDAPPNHTLDLLDAKRAAHQARLELTVELARRIELREAYIERLAKMDKSLGDKTPSGKTADDASRNHAALRAAQAEAALELARERYRDQLGPAEVEILEDTAARLQLLFDQVNALYMVGAKGGEAERRARAGYECGRARAHLARACGDRPAALADLHRACEFAFQEVRTRHVQFDATEPFDMNAEVAGNRNEVEARLELIEYARLLGDQEQVDWAERGGQ